MERVLRRARAGRLEVVPGARGRHVGEPVGHHEPLFVGHSSRPVERFVLAQVRLQLLVATGRTVQMLMLLVGLLNPPIRCPGSFYSQLDEGLQPLCSQVLTSRSIFSPSPDSSNAGSLSVAVLCVQYSCLSNCRSVL